MHVGPGCWGQDTAVRPQIDYYCRLDCLWKKKFKKEHEEFETMESVNRLLLENVLPAHVAAHFIGDKLNEVRGHPGAGSRRARTACGGGSWLPVLSVVLASPVRPGTQAWGQRPGAQGARPWARSACQAGWWRGPGVPGCERSSPPPSCVSHRARSWLSPFTLGTQPRAAESGHLRAKSQPELTLPGHPTELLSKGL